MASNGGQTTIDQITREQAASALRKRNAGKKPTREETRALARVKKADEEERRWQYYASIPQKHWRTMSGRQTKQINEQAARYGIPFDGASIDLPSVVRALHDFLASHKARLAVSDEEDALFAAGSNSPALERWRTARAAHAELDLGARRRQLLDREAVHTTLGQMAGILRSMGESLQKQFGDDALRLLNEALNEFDELTQKWFADPDDGPRDKPADA